MENLIGKKIRGFKFDNDTKGLTWLPHMEKYIGEEGIITGKRTPEYIIVSFEDGKNILYPLELAEQHLIDYKPEKLNSEPHYDNKNIDSSLFIIAEKLGLNHHEFDIFKRICRIRKKGQFKDDIRKIINTALLYEKEYNSI